MDWSLCDSKILLALHLTDSEQLTANPGAFCLSAPTQRFFSIKVCCTVAVLTFHRCVLSFISKQWPAARERGFPDSHISLAPVALSIKNHLRDPPPPDILDFSLHSCVNCCMWRVLILTLNLCVLPDRACMCSAPSLYVPNFHFWRRSVFSSSSSCRSPLILSRSETGWWTHSLPGHTYNLDRKTHTCRNCTNEKATVKWQKDKYKDDARVASEKKHYLGDSPR